MMFAGFLPVLSQASRLLTAPTIFVWPLEAGLAARVQSRKPLSLVVESMVTQPSIAPDCEKVPIVSSMASPQNVERSYMATYGLIGQLESLQTHLTTLVQRSPVFPKSVIASFFVPRV